MAEETTTPSSSATIGEIELGPSKSDQFLDKNFKTIIISLVVIGVVVCIFMIKSVTDKQDQEQAGSALYRAQEADEYSQIVSDYSKSPSAGTALILQANLHIQAEELEKAVTSLKTYLNDYPNHAAASKAKLSLASIYQRQDNFEGAKVLYSSLQSGDDAFASASYIGLADIAFIQGDKTTATALLEEGKELFDGTSFAAVMSERLNLLNYELPEIIEPDTTVNVEASQAEEEATTVE